VAPFPLLPDSDEPTGFRHTDLRSRCERFESVGFRLASHPQVTTRSFFKASSNRRRSLFHFGFGTGCSSHRYSTFAQRLVFLHSARRHPRLVATWYARSHPCESPPSEPGLPEPPQQMLRCATHSDVPVKLNPQYIVFPRCGIVLPAPPFFLFCRSVGTFTACREPHRHPVAPRSSSAGSNVSASCCHLSSVEVCPRVLRGRMLSITPSLHGIVPAVLHSG